LSGNTFNFADITYVDGSYENENGMVPGTCEPDEELNLLSDDNPCHCHKGTKYAKINVIGRDDEPVEDANVVFGVCPLEHSGGGTYEGEIGCGSENLLIYEEGYEPVFEKDVSGDTLSPSSPPTHKLHGIPEIKINFYQVKTLLKGRIKKEEQGKYSYMDASFAACYDSDNIDGDFYIDRITCDIEKVSDSIVLGSLKRGEIELPFPPNMNAEAMGNCFDDILGQAESCGKKWWEFWKESTEECIKGLIKTAGECTIANNGILNNVEIDYMPGGYPYTIEAKSMDITNFKINGYIDNLDAPYEISENDPIELNVYIPTRQVPDDKEGYDIDDEGKECLKEFMKTNCGIETPITESPLTYNGHVYNKVIHLMNPIKKCLNIDGILDDCGSSFDIGLETYKIPEGCEQDEHTPCETRYNCDEEGEGGIEAALRDCGIRLI